MLCVGGGWWCCVWWLGRCVFFDGWVGGCVVDGGTGGRLGVAMGGRVDGWAVCVRECFCDGVWCVWWMVGRWVGGRVCAVGCCGWLWVAVGGCGLLCGLCGLSGVLGWVCGGVCAGWGGLVWYL